MIRFILLLFTGIVFLSGANNFNGYYSLIIGPSEISRDYSVSMRNNGTFLNKETNEKIVGVKGNSYSFNEDISHTRVDFIYGIQKENYGNFYEIGFYTGSVLDEVFLSFGKTFPNITFSKRWFNPYLKGSLGFGLTGADLPQPSSLSYSYGLGFLSSFGESFSSRIGFDLINRKWSDISHSYGSEKWEESETRLYFGGMYFY